jgi:hypothetical protein
MRTDHSRFCSPNSKICPVYHIAGTNMLCVEMLRHSARNNSVQHSSDDYLKGSLVTHQMHEGYLVALYKILLCQRFLSLR